MSNKNDMISEIYFDKSGYGSTKTTLDGARKKDKPIIEYTIGPTSTFYSDDQSSNPESGDGLFKKWGQRYLQSTFDNVLRKFDETRRLQHQ